MGQFDLAYNSLPKELNLGKNDKPLDIEIRYYQRKAAWIIISQRNDNLKREAIESLEKLEKLLFSHNEDNNPLWLWHFYNIKANLCEWEENYDEAINFYKKCLAIPALGSFEYGATFVNMAISYRFKYILETIKNDELMLKMSGSSLRKAKKYTVEIMASETHEILNMIMKDNLYVK